MLGLKSFSEAPYIPTGIFLILLGTVVWIIGDKNRERCNMGKKEHNSGVYAHKLAPFAAVNGGAEEFAFLMPTTLPLISFRGPARLAGQFLPFSEEAPAVSLHPIGAPQGLPFVNQDIYTSRITRDKW